MAGYSGTPLPKKLGIKAGHRVALLHAPDAFDDTLGELPEEVTVQRSLRGTARFDVLVFFSTRYVRLTTRFDALRARMTEAAGLWIAWPKKSSGVATDLDENKIRQFALAQRLVDNKVCAIDETWSGLRLVIRREDRRGKTR